jgi:hypothetical protein
LSGTDVRPGANAGEDQKEARRSLTGEHGWPSAASGIWRTGSVSCRVERTTPGSLRCRFAENQQGVR